MKIKKIIFLFVLLLSYVHQTFGQQKPQPIAHALGSIDGYVYTNSREAMNKSLEKGYKYLEVDMDSTSDGVIVASHDWAYFNDITNHSELKDTMISFEEFSTRKIYDMYTPITIQEIIDTLKNNPDVSIVTDKISDPDIIEKYFSEIKERVYVECFSEEDYFELKEKGYNVMFSTDNANDILIYITKNLLKGYGKIDFITTSVDQDSKELRKIKCIMPLKVSMYTINTEELLNEHMDEIDFFYSDFYDPSTDSFTFNTEKE